MCAIKYTEKCLPATYVYILFLHPPSVHRGGARGCARALAPMHEYYSIPIRRHFRPFASTLSAQGSAIPMGFHVPNTRPPCSRSLNTISPFNRHRLRSSFPSSPPPRALRPSARRCSSFCPRIGRMLLGDDATEEEGFIRSNSGLPGWEYRTN